MGSKPTEQQLLEAVAASPGSNLGMHCHSPPGLCLEAEDEAVLLQGLNGAFPYKLLLSEGELSAVAKPLLPWISCSPYSLAVWPQLKL